MTAKNQCDISVSLDCDGQDDINAVDAMVEAYKSGFEVVYGVRSDRSSDSFFKRFTAQTYYKLLKHFGGAEVIYNHADYRLLSNRVLNDLSRFKEVNIYLRGLIPLIGHNSTTVEYSRSERIAGTSHYPLKKMLELALDGITSFSIKPIQIIATLGIGFSFIGLIGIVYAVIVFALGHTVSGWASLVCIISLVGGLQLLGIGIIGEYVGKTYMESKHRPMFIIEDSTFEKDKDSL